MLISTPAPHAFKPGHCCFWMWPASLNAPCCCMLDGSYSHGDLIPQSPLHLTLLTAAAAGAPGLGQPPP